MKAKLPVVELVKKGLVAVIAAFLCALSMNLFLIPAHVYASGINGAAQLITDILADWGPFHLSVGLLILLLNLPIAWLGWVRVGRSFTLFSFITVGLTALFLSVIPVYPLSTDIMLNSIFGGMISAIGVGLALKFGISTGGLDIIAIYLTRRNHNAHSGRYFLILNGIVIVAAGAIYEWQFALYTLISRFVNSYVIDMIHTKYQKLTVMIITDKKDELVHAIQDEFDRGTTVIPSIGGFTGSAHYTLLVVISHYELYRMEQIVKTVDPRAFTDIMETNKIIGRFYGEEQQKAVQQMKHGCDSPEFKRVLGESDYDYYRKLFTEHK
ncbi:MAG: YitT family protein [Sporolactobacillus sp.]